MMERFRKGCVVCIFLLIAACNDRTPTEPRQFTFTDLIRGVAISPDGLTVSPGESIQMRASTIPFRPVVWEWSVEPSAFATIDQSGLLLPVIPGDLIVRACADVPNRICGKVPLFVR